MSNDKMIDQWFVYHPPPSDEVKDLHETLRSRFKSLALLLNDRLPPSVEKDNAIDTLRMALMWSNAAVACNQGEKGEH